MKNCINLSRNQHNFKPNISNYKNYKHKTEMNDKNTSFVERQTQDLERRLLSGYLGKVSPIQRTNSQDRGVDRYQKQASIEKMEKLYEEAFIRQEKQTIKYQQQIEEQQAKIIAPKISKKSQKMSNNRFEVECQKLFELLDSDNDGLISAERIDIDSIKPERLKVLFPILVQVENQNLTVSLAQFVEMLRTHSKVSK